eukprot:m.7148 g.7148  ORF g.7148 m.7148 type:complete len:165 (-) comp8723_c0_seq2:171-665(-)
MARTVLCSVALLLQLWQFWPPLPLSGIESVVTVWMTSWPLYVYASSANPMFGRESAINPVYDGDAMESEVGLYSQVQGTSDEPVQEINAYDEAMFDGHEASGPNGSEAQPTYESAEFANEDVYDNEDMFEDDVDQAGTVSCAQTSDCSACTSDLHLIGLHSSRR